MALWVKLYEAVGGSVVWMAWVHWVVGGLAAGGWRCGSSLSARHYSDAVSRLAVAIKLIKTAFDL